MSVSGADENAACRNRLDLLSRELYVAVGESEKVQGDNGKPLAAVPYHEARAAERIVDPLAGPAAVVAGKPDLPLRSYVQPVSASDQFLAESLR
jgi:hypothetical protein